MAGLERYIRDSRCARSESGIMHSCFVLSLPFLFCMNETYDPEQISKPSFSSEEAPVKSLNMIRLVKLTVRITTVESKFDPHLNKLFHPCFLSFSSESSQSDSRTVRVPLLVLSIKVIHLAVPSLTCADHSDQPSNSLPVLEAASSSQ